MDNSEEVTKPRDATKPRAAPAAQARVHCLALVFLTQLRSAFSAKTTVRSQRRWELQRKNETSTLSPLPSMHTSHWPPLRAKSFHPHRTPQTSPLPTPSLRLPFPGQARGGRAALVCQGISAGRLLGAKRSSRRTRATVRAKPKSGVRQRGCLTSPALSSARRAAVLSLVVTLITRSKARKYFNRSAGNGLDQNKRKALYTEDMRGLQPTCEPLKLFFLFFFIN